MDEVRDGIHYAWKGAMRGAKKGLKLTKNVLRSIPVERLRVPGQNGVMSRTGTLRRLFQLRYGAQIDNERGERVAAAEATDFESEEEEPLTDQQLHEHVDKKYFDKSYEAMKYEITQMEFVDGRGHGGDDTQQQLQQLQRQATEASIRELRLKCDLVSATLKKRVLANSKGFVSGVEEIRLINDRLLETSSDCKKGRNIIRKAKNAAAEQMKILAYHRKRGNCKATLSLLEAMRQLYWKRTQLMTLIEGGKIFEAAELLQQHGDIEHEDRIQKMHCMGRIIDEWKEYRDNKETLKRCQEVSLTECLTAKFIPSKYCNAFEASYALGTSDHVCVLVVKTLWKSAVYILTKSLIEVSDIKEEDVSIADIAAAIHPDHLMLCLCQMSAKIMDFLFLFATVRKLHKDSSRADYPLATLHAAALEEITKVGHKLGQDLVEKIALVLDKLQLGSVDVERVLHLFFVVSILIESISVLGLEKSGQAAARTQVKASLVRYMTKQFQEPKAIQILKFMAEDAWVVGGVSALELQVVLPLPPETYRCAVREVKGYLTEASIDAPGSHENPFYATHMLTLQDTSHMVQTESFREDVARRGAQGIPSMLTASSVAVANTLLEYVARIVARFAPLATETLGWAEDLVSLYVYTAADNFVSISRAVRLEHQVDLSESTQATLIEMRAGAERAARQYTAAAVSSTSPSSFTTEDDLHGSFPPRVWSRIHNFMTSQTHQYALVSRAVAGQSCVTLVHLLETTIRSVAPLLPQVTVEQRLQRCNSMKAAAEELLHVGLHRLCQAIFPMENVIQSISKIRANEKEVQASVYVKQVVEEMGLLNAKRQTMPTPELEQLFMKRLIFAVQMTLLREYCRLAKKKLSDAFIMQLSVDAQSFQQKVGAKFGKALLVLPDLLSSFVKAGFIEEREQRLEWVKTHHAVYCTVDMVQWFSGGDRTMRLQLEDVLAQVRHRDAIPVLPFR
ncbi:hypothetical protein C3747_11g45 [Trypanosoma cruzi]|uniref:Vacuolar protein sorting-associated protein 54 N-terminal domain-containing protein n=2 Tax=Trypanosoma cruzi TaxID=5693 RepID=Q4DI04_TRYCC|nr:hypothetical protein, conserved [Trypanosoma cruzi]EAN92156.1 hypothetical protein, conserved [Trypanosoma cruzi]PWV18942.1 hypothetical protein C3747_11g45 [Trypanosoma cruzi]RNC59456.1 hypothetical protein TcCL_ESM02903 [Trypanosoma cruzi]|eukprot:XP_814007.1 hypothetical protein [Trypanosoma cruzi strain CL Brener]